jgi:hypothetical protein
MWLCFRGDWPGKTLTGDLLWDYATCLASTERPWRICFDDDARRYKCLGMIGTKYIAIE